MRDARGLTHPWGQPYLYRSPGAGGTAYEVYSPGSDGRPCGSGDSADAASN